MAYRFDSDIRPDKPLDPNDPCPPGYQSVICDAKDRSKIFWGYTPSHLVSYRNWELREAARLKKRMRVK